MAVGNLYQLKTWLQRESGPLAVSRWALLAGPFVDQEAVRLGQIKPSDTVNDEIFHLLRAEAEKLAGKPYSLPRV